jgi:CheY-like chemotaxis protein
VLVVDDAIENIMVIEAILEQEYCIISAENGQQAIDFVWENAHPINFT